jgi:hypothetical protein
MTSEVKGVWFVSARRYLDEQKMHGVADRILAKISAPHRAAFAEPGASEWYPEEALAETLRLLRHETRTGSDEQFTQLMEGITQVGINRFFRLLLSVASADFVLRKIPIMWHQIRRGDGQVQVTTDARGALIQYTEFPWFHDPVYPLMTLGSIRALLVVVGAPAHVSLGPSTRSSQQVLVSYSAR